MPNEVENFKFCIEDLFNTCSQEEKEYILKLSKNKMYKKILIKYFKEANTPPLQNININDLNKFIEYL